MELETELEPFRPKVYEPMKIKLNDPPGGPTDHVYTVAGVTKADTPEQVTYTLDVKDDKTFT